MNLPVRRHTENAAAYILATALECPSATPVLPQRSENFLPEVRAFAMSLLKDQKRRRRPAEWAEKYRFTQESFRNLYSMEVWQAAAPKTSIHGCCSSQGRCQLQRREFGSAGACTTALKSTSISGAISSLYNYAYCVCRVEQRRRNASRRLKDTERTTVWR